MYFIYFIPNGGTLDQKLLDGHGLGYLTANKMVSKGMMANGPEGFAGVLIADNRMPTGDLYYRPEKQKWEKSLNGQFWVGFYLDSPPTERSLRREAILDGHGVDLLEGQSFTIPVARCFPAGTKLPQSMRLTSAGALESKVLKKYEAFCNRAERLWKTIMEQAGDNQSVEPLSKKEQWDLLIEAIRFNYYLSNDEVNLLEMFTSANFTPGVMAIVDGPTLIKLGEKLISDEAQEELKKNSPQSENEITQSTGSGAGG